MKYCKAVEPNSFVVRELWCISQLLLRNKPPQNYWLKLTSIYWAQECVCKLGASADLGRGLVDLGWIYSCICNQLVDWLTWHGLRGVDSFLFRVVSLRTGQPRCIFMFKREGESTQGVLRHGWIYWLYILISVLLMLWHLGPWSQRHHPYQG